METQIKRTWRDALESILVAVILALVVRTFIVSAYRVPTSSMAPTLIPGDFILSYKIPYGVRLPFSSTKIGQAMPARGELVVFTYPDRPRTFYVKRVVGVPGDRIEIRAGVLYVNESSLQQEKLPNYDISSFSDPMYFSAYLERASEGERVILRKLFEDSNEFGPILVPPGKVFVLGDHRDTSDDSRYWGPVPIERVEGRVFLIWLSLQRKEAALSGPFPSVRWDRLFTVL